MEKLILFKIECNKCFGVPCVLCVFVFENVIFYYHECHTTGKNNVNFLCVV